MINFKLIYKVLGSLLFIVAGMMVVCGITAWHYDEDDLFAFMVSALFTFISALVLRVMGIGADNNLSRKDSYLVVTLAWLVFSLFGTLPFLISGYITSFTNAFFESMSGFTTTGATIIDDVEALPHGILVFRTMSQWLGGLGIVFFTIALLPSMVGGSVKVFAAEATGPIKTKLHPRLTTSAKWIWMIYILLTIACMFSYYIFGMDPFDAVNYGMTTTATGGFSTHNMSTEFFNSPAIEYTCVVFCFLSGVNFILLWTAFAKLQVKRLLSSSEFQLYIGLIAVATAYLMFQLMWHNNYDLEHAFRSSVFSAVSFITTTGLFNDDAGQWPHVTWIVLAGLMFFGGMSGSTSGGMKCIRVAMVAKVIRNEFRQLIHPNAVLPVRVDGNDISQQKRNSLLALLAIYLVLFVLASFLLTAIGVDVVNSITIIISCLGNVGPTLGVEIGPTMSWDMLPPVAKWVCSFYMLLGRLEIFTVLVIFTPRFWKE